MKNVSRRSRLLVGAALVSVAGLALAGCTTSASTSSSTPTTSKPVTIAEVNEATSFNYNTPQGNLDTNGMIWYLTQPQFTTLSDDYTIVHNDDLGSFKKLSDDPLKVEYTLNKGDKWSDGKAMNADDLLLGWAVASCYFDSKKTTYFATAGGCTFGSEKPTVSNDNRTITWTYTKPYVDWEIVNPIQFPAHVVASEIGVSESDLVSALTDTAAGSTNPAPNATLKKAAKFINTGYDASSLPTDKKLLVSGGPLKVTDWTPKQSMTFEPNKYYKGDHAVTGISKLVMRFIADANAQVTALQNGEVDAIQPQASADTTKALDADSSLKVQTGAQVAYDHLDLNFGASVFKSKDVREAFLKTIPRDEILKDIVTPIDPEAKVLNSQLFLPGQDGYEDAVAGNDSSDYGSVDIAGAKKLLNGATPTVKILYNSENPNRVDAFQAIQASAAKAGIKVTDGGSPDWSTLLSGGDYDASIFGWVNPGAGNAAIPQLFQTGNPGNYNKYADAATSALAVKTQTTLDADTLKQQKIDIDKMVFDDAYGLPLFQLPGLFATNSKVTGIKYFGGQTGMVWNIWDWK